MTINYPNQFDNDESLYRVYDSLKVRLGRDYNPGDVLVYANGDIGKFPESGIFTLVDICSDNSSTPCTYEGKHENYFYGVKSLKDDGFKNKKTAYITQQVMAEYHNIIKDALIEIQKTIGTTTSKNKNDIYSRISYLNSLIYAPKAWFDASKTKGVCPFITTFTSKSKGTVGPVGNVLYTWTFSDESQEKTLEPNFTKTFEKEGKYSVELTVTNEYGEDTIEFIDMIHALPKAPTGIIEIIPNSEQYLKDNGTLRTKTNENVNLTLNSNDNIKTYEWNNGNTTKDSVFTFQNSGIYDIDVKISNDSFRIIKKENVVDVLSEQNLYLWVKENDYLYCYEYGDNGFKPRNEANIECKSENINIAKKNLSSGNNGNCVIYFNNIDFYEYNAFKDIYLKVKSLEAKDNWISFNSNDKIYILYKNTKTTINLANNYASDTVAMQSFNYLNGAEDIEEAKNAQSIWIENKGFLLNGTNFYKTEGVTSNPFINLNKIQNPKITGKLANVNNQVHLFNNSEYYYVYNDFINTWEKYGPFNKLSNSDDLLVVGFGEFAYLSYGDNSFYLFDGKTFQRLEDRPGDKQVGMFIY